MNTNKAQETEKICELQNSFAAPLLSALYLCPVCFNADFKGICKLHKNKSKQEQCEDFVYQGLAHWMFHEECPCCDGPGMVYQDKFGAACAISGCEFRQDYR